MWPWILRKGQIPGTRGSEEFDTMFERGGVGVGQTSTTNCSFTPKEFS